MFVRANAFFIVKFGRVPVNQRNTTLGLSVLYYEAYAVKV